MGVYINYTIFYPNELIATVRTRVNRTPKRLGLAAVGREFSRATAGGLRRADVRGFISGVTASKTVTCSASAAANGDTLVIGGTTLTVAAAPANESEFIKGSTDPLHAAATVACINAHSVLSKIVWAAVTGSASGILTIYAIVPGPIGNLVTLAETGNGFTIGGAALSGGTSDAVKRYQVGYDTGAHNAG